MDHDLDIAIVGMSCRFPGANDTAAFWRNLCHGTESISVFTEEELAAEGVDPSILNRPNYVRAGAVLDDPALFDASFFGYAPREAELTDPQHRLFLECAWEALEHAGYDSDRYDGRIGVYGGALINTYLLFSGLLSKFESQYLPILLGNHNDYLTTRVSYKLNLRGPSVAVQTACSTSLVAVHMACQSLLNEECDMALAGGVSVRVPHRAGYLYHEGSIFSPDGHCRPFDAKAQGTVFGSGVGLVLLKRYSEAVGDGDHIHAVIKGSAINNDGSAKMSYTAPSVEAQAEVIAEALANASVEASTITYVEAHGTGTSVGDPIEVAALSRAFRTSTESKGFCAIGSVKGNIGHLDNAAGVAGLIKAVLALEHGMIPASLNFERPNPGIDFEDSPFYVNTTLSEWHSHTGPRRAGVTSLGAGGTNAHVVLEEAPTSRDLRECTPWQLLVLSAKTSTALDRATTLLAEYLRQHPEIDLADVAHTLQSGRRAFSHRRIAACRDREDAINILEAQDPMRVFSDILKSPSRDVVYMCSGQGSQHINMGLELYETEPVFRREIDRCSEELSPLLSLYLRDVLYPRVEDEEEAGQKLTQTWLTQPALFVFEYALAKLWMAWGVHPKALLGHSIGEYVAACLAGVFSLKDALRLVADRGRLMQGLPAGSMLAIPLPPQEIQPFLDGKLDLAVINAPSLCVVAGEGELIEELEHRLSESGLGCRPLHTSHAFHSRMMDPIMEEFAARVAQMKLSSPQIPFMSNVTGAWITAQDATDPGYWARHLRQTVRYSECLQELMKDANSVLLEIGPGRTLSTLAQCHPSSSEGQVILPSTRHPLEQGSDRAFILTTLGRLWLAGVDVDWCGLHAGERRFRAPLPTYPFEHKRYWLSAKPPSGTSYRVSSSYQVSEEPSVAEEGQAKLRGNRDRESLMPSNAEQSIASIWQEVLGIDRVGPHDDFFALGGNSLLATQVMSKLREIFGLKLSLPGFFQAPTVAGLAATVTETSDVSAQAAGERKGDQDLQDALRLLGSF